jgi:hypothetical protein
MADLFFTSVRRPADVASLDSLHWDIQGATTSGSVLYERE